jgi:hypothetical protein
MDPAGLKIASGGNFTNLKSIDQIQHVEWSQARTKTPFMPNGKFDPGNGISINSMRDPVNQSNGFFRYVVAGLALRLFHLWWRATSLRSVSGGAIVSNPFGIYQLATQNPTPRPEPNKYVIGECS